MRFHLIAAVAAAAALSGCVATVPGVVAPVAPAPAPVPTAPIVVTPATPGATVVVTPTPTVKTVDAGSARAVVSAELARKLPGKPVGAMTDCVMANATMAEQADIVTRAGTRGAGDAIAAVVSKPATGACLKKTVA